MAKRRGNSEGTITQRSDGRWEARLSLSDGKRKCYYGRTRQEVQRKLAQARRDVDEGLPLVDERLLFGSYIQTWIETSKLRVDPSSWDTYETQVRFHIIPALGKYSLTKLRDDHIRLFYVKLLEDGKAPATVKKIHAILSHALGEAYKRGLTQRNVMHLVEAPKVTRRNMIPLSEEQLPIFLEAIKGERFEALYVLALSTGMRRSELLALHWQDIDLDHATLQVSQGLQRQGKKFFLADPKSEHSKRRIALSRTVVEALQAHRRRQLQERLLAGQAWRSDLDLVFCTPLGEQKNPSSMTDVDFRRVLKKSGLELGMRFHDLRHTAATLLLARGVNPKVVSEMLGHSDVATTLRIYHHVTPHMQQLAADVMDMILSS